MSAVHFMATTSNDTHGLVTRHGKSHGLKFLAQRQQSIRSRATEDVIRQRVRDASSQPPFSELVVAANIGQKSVKLMFEDGQLGTTTLQDARVRKPLLAVCDTVDKGNVVIFSAKGACLAPGDSKEAKEILELMEKLPKRVKVYRENGVFKIPAWVVPPAEKPSGFHRQGM